MAPKIVVHVDSSTPIDLEISVKDDEATVSVVGSSSDKVSGKGCKGIEKEGSSMTSGALGKCKNEGYVKIEKDDGEKTTSYEDWDVVPASSGSPHPPSHSPPSSASPHPPSHSPPGHDKSVVRTPSPLPEDDAQAGRQIYVICIRTGERIHYPTCGMVRKMREKDVIKRPLCPDCLGEGLSSNEQTLFFNFERPAFIHRAQPDNTCPCLHGSPLVQYCARTVQPCKQCIRISR